MSSTPTPPPTERREPHAARPDAAGHLGSFTRPDGVLQEAQPDAPPGWQSPDLHQEDVRHRQDGESGRLTTVVLGLAILAVLAGLGYLAVLWP